jgi:hypothetical protein
MTRTYWRIPEYEGRLTRRIRKLTAGNPKKGKSALRFARYRTGMTIQDYIRSCDEIGMSKLALFDITWDTDPRRNFIELYD